MKFSVEREDLLGVLQSTVSVVERRQTLPILSNILLMVSENELVVTGTDTEVEVTAKVSVKVGKRGTATVPGKKILEICKSLLPGVEVTIEEKENKVIVRAGRGRFVLATLPSNDFPGIGFTKENSKLNISASVFKDLVTHTQFAMAHQDVRYYLNGLLLEIGARTMRAVATDGHRLAMCERQFDSGVADEIQSIVPRKGISEILRLIFHAEGNVEVESSANFFRVSYKSQTITVKLVEGKFPDYERVIPKSSSKVFFVGREALKAALQRTSILSNEKFRGVKLSLVSGLLKTAAHNPEQEEAEEEIEINYSGESLEIGFNVSYLLDILNVIASETIQIGLSDSNSSCVIRDPADEGTKFVVMPMRL